MKFFGHVRYQESLKILANGHLTRYFRLCLTVSISFRMNYSENITLKFVVISRHPNVFAHVKANEEIHMLSLCKSCYMSVKIYPFKN
jgi:hypothetical protein